MTAIEFENISKQYRLGLVSTRTLSHDLNRWWRTRVLRQEDPYLKIGSVNDRETKADSDYVWALKDINLKIEQGDVVGIIGRNGAGKSTLLKLLSRVTNPTTGTIRARGRIASLLEVGTGFHSELTGRENIYMNGAIMGMSKGEITRKLDEIVDFSGCERYIDTPVKRYSSGMTVRLGFAVAAHLDPDILVVDEVLAVGDAGFQKKAIGKMQDVSKEEGRTVLFVSHNMTAVKSFCDRGILLENGMLKETGAVNSVVAHYLRGDSIENNSKDWPYPVVRAEGFELLHIDARAANQDISAPICMDVPVWITVKYRLRTGKTAFHLTLHFKNDQGTVIFSSSGAGRCYAYEHAPGVYVQRCVIPANFLNSGEYSLDLFAVDAKTRPFVVEYDVISFTVLDKRNSIGTYLGREPGDVTPCLDYQEERVNDCE